MKKNKILISFTLFIFAAVALYLCPCASAAIEKNSLSLVEASSHDCCDKMPNCPLEKESRTGLQSLIPSFINAEITSIIPTKDLLANNLYALFSSLQAATQPSLIFIMEKESFLKSSPKLFIQYAVLRI